jgi:formylmethanofuran dehydrogenase subunit E
MVSKERCNHCGEMVDTRGMSMHKMFCDPADGEPDGADPVEREPEPEPP